MTAGAGDAVREMGSRQVGQSKRATVKDWGLLPGAVQVTGSSCDLCVWNSTSETWIVRGCTRAE